MPTNGALSSSTVPVLTTTNDDHAQKSGMTRPRATRSTSDGLHSSNTFNTTTTRRTDTASQHTIKARSTVPGPTRSTLTICRRMITMASMPATAPQSTSTAAHASTDNTTISIATTTGATCTTPAMTIQRQAEHAPLRRHKHRRRRICRGFAQTQTQLLKQNHTLCSASQDQRSVDRTIVSHGRARRDAEADAKVEIKMRRRCWRLLMRGMRWEAVVESWVRDWYPIFSGGLVSRLDLFQSKWFVN